MSRQQVAHHARANKTGTARHHDNAGFILRLSHRRWTTETPVGSVPLRDVPWMSQMNQYSAELVFVYEVLVGVHINLTY